MELKKGDKVILKGFTGVKLGVFEVESATKKTVTVLKRNGDEMVFDRKTGRQVNVEEGKERYANSIMEDDGSYVAPSTRGATKKKAAKSSAKKAKPEPEEEEDNEEEEEPPKSKKTSKKKAAKKAAPVEPEDDEDFDEDFEEDDEDEYEEEDED